MMEIMIRDSFYQEMVHNEMNDGKCDGIFYLSREGSSKGLVFFTTPWAQLQL